MATGSATTERPWSGLLLITMAAVTWGTIGIAVSLLYRVAATEAFSIGFLRLLIAAPALLLVNRLLVGSRAFRVVPRDLGVIAIIGAAFAAYQLCYFAAIAHIGVAIAVLANICSAPIFVALLAWIFLRETPTRAALVALVGAVCGTALLVGGPRPDAAGSAPLGVALALGAGFSYAMVAVASRAVAPRYHPLQPIAIAFSLGALLLLPLALSRGIVLDYPIAGWLLLLHLGLVPTALAYALYLWGLRTTPATSAAIISLLEPLISSALAVALLGERLSLTGLLGGALLLGSLVLLSVHGARQATAVAPQ
jgi:drug/metabolite transporter, DME family